MFNRKGIFMLAILAVFLSSMMAVSAEGNLADAESNVTDYDSLHDGGLEIYVSPEGDDDAGDGSSGSPFSSISRAIDISKENSVIILKDGVYKGNLNTNIVVNKDVTIKTSSDGVTIDGENKNAFFKVNSGYSLVLDNIRFVNGFTDSLSQLAVINNQGNLFISNSSFTTMKNQMSTFFNEGNLTLDSLVVSASSSNNMAQIITNLGDCTVSNSQFKDSAYNSLSTVYNFKNINIINSKLSSISSDNAYDEAGYEAGYILIQNSSIGVIEIENASCKISGSKVNGRFSFRNVNASVDGSNFTSSSSYINPLSVYDSNFTAVHSIFASSISSGHSRLNITYSAILQPIIGGGKQDYLYAPYNWWGVNSGPVLNYVVNRDIKNWAVVTFEVEDGNLSVGTHSKFITSLNKWSDGNSTYAFGENEYLPTRPVGFEAQNGKFIYGFGNLNGNFENYLVGNSLDCNVFTIVDNQRLSLPIGEGLYSYSYFVAPWGRDSNDAGSFDDPFHTLQYAVSKVGNGNTICLLEGIHNATADSGVLISKNITVVGLGDVSLMRYNAMNIFFIQEWGNLVVKNIRFGVDVRSYSDNLFVVKGGNLTVSNCSFSHITSDAVITTGAGVESKGSVIIENSRFYDVVGAAVNGISKVLVKNSSFEKFSNFYTRSGTENLNAVFTITGAIEIYGSLFKGNSMGILTLHPFTYSTSSLLGATASGDSNSHERYAYVENSTFINNVFTDMQNSYSTIGVGFDIYDSYGSFSGFIHNSTFIENVGRIANANGINSSIFISNHGLDYGGAPLLKALTVENSAFINNLNRYVDYNKAYIGEGIVSADSIFNSTFINNTASFGGAVSNTKEVHYCVFVNNSAEYGGNDIYSYSGDVDYSSNWWGDNQKPGSDKIFIFLGNLKLDDWIIMSFESISNGRVEAALNKLRDDDGNIRTIGYHIPVRQVYFGAENGNISPGFTCLSKNVAIANVTYDVVSQDFKIFARIDNQLLDLDIMNTNTQIVMGDVAVRGNHEKFSMDLINVNGHKISNQTLAVSITDSDNKTQVFTIETDDNGHATFNIDLPVGKYDVGVTYLGNGYFERCDAVAKLEVMTSLTNVISYNYTYYGKNNLFYAILEGENNYKLVNYTVVFTIINFNGQYRSISAQTDNYGRAEVLLSLDVGEYDIQSKFEGDSWYASSSSMSHIAVNPVNSSIAVPSVTFYGEGNIYNITLKDSYGTLIRGENVAVVISKGNLSDRFTLTTDSNGIASLKVNYVPGSYDVEASYAGDKIYGPASGKGTIKIEKVLTMISAFHHSTIPVNGIFSVTLTDMYGHRISNETVTLDCYKGALIKSYAVKTDAAGEALFVLDLDEGTYLVTMNYGGNIWYEESTGAATIVVSKDATLESIYINSTDLIQYYGENRYLVIEFNDPNAYNQYGKLITVTLSSQTWSQAYEVTTDIFGLARMQINLNPGEYNVTYKYSNSYYNIFGSGSNRISVYKMPITMFAGDLIMKSTESVLYPITLRNANNEPVKNMQVHVVVNGKEFDAVTNYEGVANVVLDLDIGNHEILYYVDNPNYVSSSGVSMIMVVDSNRTSSSLASNDVLAYDNQTICLTVNLNDALNKGLSSYEVTVEITSLNGDSIKNMTSSTDKDGKAFFNVDLVSGNYLAKFSFAGSALYLQAYSQNTIEVLPTDDRRKTVIYSGEVQANSSQKYHVVLTDENGTALSDKRILFSIGNETYESITDGEGRAYLDDGFISGICTIGTRFMGDEQYGPSSISVKAFVSGGLTKIYAPSLVKYYRNGTQFHALLVNSYSVPLVNRTVSVLLDNSVYNCTTDENGWITLNVDLKPGHYEVDCYYYGANRDENSFNKTTIDVLTTVIGHDEVKHYGNGPYMDIRFLDGVGNPIRNTQFVIGIDGKKYMAATDDEGVFELTLDLNSGDHIISANNPYDGLSVSYKLTILPTIFVDSLVKVLGDDNYYSATFLDGDGNFLVKKQVNIIINGVKYTKKTDENGAISLDMEYVPNTYLVTVINPVTGEYVENSIKVLHPISQNKDLTMYFKSGKYFKVRIIGMNGKAVGAGKIVKFKVKGVVYKVKTDKNGYASLKINLNPNKYTIDTHYNGFKVSNKITVKPLLIAKNISKKKVSRVKFNVKLINGKGKAVSGKKITIKFKGKTYKVKTNGKGIATVKLTLKPGKYTIKSVYGKSKIQNTINIKK